MSESKRTQGLQEALNKSDWTRGKERGDPSAAIPGRIDFECPMCQCHTYRNGDAPIAGANWYYCCDCGTRFADPQRFSQTRRGELGEAENGCFVCGCNEHADLYGLPEYVNAPLEKMGVYCRHCSAVLYWY